MISIDQFKTVELRVATIKSAEPHPNADRLVVLKVDLEWISGEPDAVDLRFKNARKSLASRVARSALTTGSS